jgi:hypothetical protein
MKLIHALGDKAAGSGGVKWVSFVGGALHELSVGLTFLCRVTFLMYRACLGILAKYSGTRLLWAAIVPKCVMQDFFLNDLRLAELVLGLSLS